LMVAGGGTALALDASFPALFLVVMGTQSPGRSGIHPSGPGKRFFGKYDAFKHSLAIDVPFSPCQEGLKKPAPIASAMGIEHQTHCTSNPSRSPLVRQSAMRALNFTIPGVYASLRKPAERSLNLPSLLK